MSLFLNPTSGNAVGGGGSDPSARGLTGAAKEPFAKRRKIKDFDRVPPGQIPSAPPPYTWGPLERQDWIPGITVKEDVDKATDPNAARRAQLHKDAQTLRVKLASLRAELHKALEDSRREHEIDRLKNARSTGSPLSGSTKLPQLPRATRPFQPPVQQRQEAWGQPQLATVAPGTPLHMRKGPMTLSPTTTRIMGIRAEISKARLKLAQIRSEIKRLHQNDTRGPMSLNIKLHPPTHRDTAPIQHRSAALQGVRRQWLGHPAPKPAAPIQRRAMALKVHGPGWRKKPPEHPPTHTEEHHRPRFVSRGSLWRSPLKHSQ